MTQNKKIAWEKFTPKAELFEEKTIQQDESEDVDNSEYDEEHGDMMGFINFEELISRNKYKTPFGYYDKNDDFSPYNMFECWIGHCNFRLTKNHFNLLNTSIDGVGCLKILSPYRFFIGIEKMFTFPSVRMQIQDKLCNNLDMNMENMDISYSDQSVQLIISKINDAIFNIKESEKWAIFVGNDGKVETIKNSEFDSDSDYEDKLNVLKLLKNGNIITYDSL